MKVAAAKNVSKRAGIPAPELGPMRAEVFLPKQAFDVGSLDRSLGQQAPDDENDAFVAKPTIRVLAAVEIIAQSGPITFKDLGISLGLSKATVWRLVNTLREANWVRLRKGGSVIELDPRMDDLFATANFADAEFCAASDVINDVADSFGVHIDLFTPNRKGELSLHDTSRRQTIATSTNEPLEEMLFLALYAAMTPTQFDRHMTQIASHMDAGTLHHMNSAAMRRKVQQFPGFVWSEDSRVLFASLRGALGSAAAVRLSGKTAAIDKLVLSKAYEKLAQLLPDAALVLGKGKLAAVGQ